MHISDRAWSQPSELLLGSGPESLKPIIRSPENAPPYGFDCARRGANRGDIKQRDISVVVKGRLCANEPALHEGLVKNSETP
jgi:hypothetical protein